MPGILSKIDFESFLDTLDRNQEQAAGKYIALRERLEKFFEWRNCENAEELTDIVFDRAAKKIVEGEKIINAEAYCVSIAKFVLMENRRNVLRTTELNENLPETVNKKEQNDESEEVQRQLQCLDKCLAKLSEDKRKLLISYFDTDEKTMIPKRKRLAEKFDITLNSLRIRISRLKTIVEKCTKNCCEEN